MKDEYDFTEALRGAVIKRKMAMAKRPEDKELRPYEIYEVVSLRDLNATGDAPFREGEDEESEDSLVD
jgi:hypothetical protein